MIYIAKSPVDNRHYTIFVIHNGSKAVLAANNTMENVLLRAKTKLEADIAQVEKKLKEVRQ